MFRYPTSIIKETGAGCPQLLPGSIAQLPDIGGAPLHSEASDIFEEGIRFPIVKLHKAGVPNQDVLDIIQQPGESTPAVMWGKP